MSTYNHLTLNERIKIMTMTPKKSAAAIAAELGRSKSTISRELRRYKDGYDAIRAQADYEQKRKACRRKRKLDDTELYALVKEKFLEQQWSPEQIQYRLRHENSQHSISSATIYRAIYAGLFNDPDWVRSGKRNLRHRVKKRLYKGAKITRGGFAISHEISERPAEAQARERLGDWEADTVAGITGGAVLTTLADPEKPFSALRPAGEEDGRGGECGDYRGTKRGDIAQHHAGQGQRVRAARGGNKALGAEFYFPPPYQPWQRGTNENTNGLLREFFPRHQDIAQYSDEYIEKCVRRLNNRPRKCLQWRTPYEVHFEKALHLV